MPIAPLSNYQNAVIDRYKSNDGHGLREVVVLPRQDRPPRNRQAGGLLVFNAVLIAIAVAVGRGGR